MKFTDHFMLHPSRDAARDHIAIVKYMNTSYKCLILKSFFPEGIESEATPELYKSHKGVGIMNLFY